MPIGKVFDYQAAYCDFSVDSITIPAATLANAMDVGDPSNFERLRWFWPDADELRRRVTAQGVDDATIARRITDWHARYGLAICPHTAAAAEVRERLRDGGDDRPWCVVATAHAAKFDTVVEHCVGGPVAVPASLARLLARPATAEPLAADFGALRSALLG